jgi:uncharacterized membrane protein YkvA (DUF1232 family)
VAGSRARRDAVAVAGPAMGIGACKAGKHTAPAPPARRRRARAPGARQHAVATPPCDASRMSLSSAAARLRQWARRIKRDVMTLWFAARDPRTPWPAKAIGLFVVAYALSPIDLIPDFIPVLGYVDDVLLLPGLIWLAVRLLPRPVREACRVQADAWLHDHAGKPASRIGALLILVVWSVAAWALWHWGLQPWLGRPAAH